MTDTWDEYPFGDPGATLRYDEAQKLAEKCRREGHVISLRNIGANPMLRPTPYTNHRGVEVDRWSCISYYFERVPGKTVLNEPHIVRPWKKDDWEINQITTPWVVGRLTRTPRAKVDVLRVEETPFEHILQWGDGDA